MEPSMTEGDDWYSGRQGVGAFLSEVWRAMTFRKRDGSWLTEDAYRRMRAVEPSEEPPLEDQLIEGRKKIIAQLDELNLRATARGRGPWARQPDYRSIIAELEDELREINAILGTEDPPNRP
jgi:hypothetical protein